MAAVRRTCHRTGVFRIGLCPLLYHYRYSVWHSGFQTGNTLSLAVRLPGGRQLRWRWLSRYPLQYHLVLYRWRMDIPYPCALWGPVVYYDHRHTLGTDEFPFGSSCFVAIW